MLGIQVRHMLVHSIASTCSLAVSPEHLVRRGVHGHRYSVSVQAGLWAQCHASHSMGRLWAACRAGDIVSSNRPMTHAMAKHAF